MFSNCYADSLSDQPGKMPSALTEAKVQGVTKLAASGNASWLGGGTRTSCAPTFPIVSFVKEVFLGQVVNRKGCQWLAAWPSAPFLWFLSFRAVVRAPGSTL